MPLLNSRIASSSLRAEASPLAEVQLCMDCDESRTLSGREAFRHFRRFRSLLPERGLSLPDSLGPDRSSQSGCTCVSNWWVLSASTRDCGVRHGIVSDKDTGEGSNPPDGVDRRGSDRRGGKDRRKQDLDPPDGVERRKGERRRGERRKLSDGDSGEHPQG